MTASLCLIVFTNKAGIQFATALTMHSFSNYYCICIVVCSEVSRHVKVVYLLI